MELHEIQNELYEQSENCQHPEYKAAADYILQITQQSLLGFIEFNDYIEMVKEVYQQVVDAPDSEFKIKLNTVLDELFAYINKEIKKAQEAKEASEA